ncbi:MAG: hypothetical protein AAFS07_09680 [Pseudomonadota bacterium]
MTYWTRAAAVVAASMGFGSAPGAAEAASLLPGSFITTADVLGPGNEITDPEGLAISGDILYVAEDSGDADMIFSINLVTGEVESFSLEATAPSLSFSSLGTGTLEEGEVVSFSFTDGAGGLGFNPGDAFVIELDNEIGFGGAPDLTLGIFGEGEIVDGFQTGELLVIDDDSSPRGNGLASAGLGVVNADGTINISVSGFPDFDFDGVVDGDVFPQPEEGDFEVFGAIVPTSSLDDFILSSFGDPEGLTVLGDSLFVGGDDGDGGGLLLELALDTFEVLGLARLPFEADGLASDGTLIYAADDDTIIAIDPETGEIVRSGTVNLLGNDFEGLTFNGSELVAGDDQGTESLVFIDPVTFAVTRVVTGDALLVSDPDGLAFSETFGLIQADADPGGTSAGLIASAVIPLPAPAGLMLAGLAALGMVAGRRRKITRP